MKKFFSILRLILPLILLASGLSMQSRSAAAQYPLTGTSPPPLAPVGPPGGYPSDAVTASTFEDLVIEKVNQERWANGQLPPLKRAAELDNAAETHSANQAERNFFGHCDLDTGTWPDDRMEAAGYQPNGWGENIAAGYGTPDEVMLAWMNSSGHKANILSTSYREIGVGFVYDAGDTAGVRKDMNTDCVSDGPSSWPYYNYWTQDFGKRTNVYPVVIDRESYATAGQSVSLYVYGQGWAEDMRFCNAGETWSAWQPYNSDASWTLSPGAGVKTVLAEIRNGTTVLSASDTIWLDQPTTMQSSGLTKSVFLPLISRGVYTGEYCSNP